MSDKVFVANVVRGGPVSRTEIGQARHGPSHIKGYVHKDLKTLRSAHQKWRRLKQRVRSDVNVDLSGAGRDGSRENSGPKLTVKIAHRHGVAGLRSTMQRYWNKVGIGIPSQEQLKHGSGLLSHEAILNAKQLPQYREKLEHLKLFDEIAEKMFSRDFKAYRTLKGLSENVFSNVNRNLRDDMLVAQENKLLSVNARRRKDKSYGLVGNKDSRQLIRQIVASALLHHGYATAKTLKQDLTKACELAERSGKNSELSGQVQERMRQVMSEINNGKLAADAVLGDVELRNLAALANEDPPELLTVSSNELSKSADRKVVKEATIRVAAKGSLNAARNFRNLLKGKPAHEQIELARDTIDATADAKPKEPHYMYLPFKAFSGGIDYKLDEGLNKYRKKPHFTIIDRGDPSKALEKPLEDIDPHHVLLINGHGAYGYDGITAVASADTLNKMSKQVRDEADLSADRLAERLEQDGLAKNHKVIRLLACYGGGDTLRYEKDENGNSLQPNRYDEAFAKRLAVALKRRGYRNIVVGGYAGSVHPRRFGERKAITVSDGGSGKLINASGLCRYFDGDGAVVSNPRNPEKAKMIRPDMEKTVADRIADMDAGYEKPEFGFPVREEPVIEPTEPTAEDFIAQLDRTKPGHRYVAELTGDSFFADTDGNAHQTPVFANRFRDYIEEKHHSGDNVDVIKDIDRLRAMRLDDDDDGQAVGTFKSGLIDLNNALDGISVSLGTRTLKKEIGKALKTDDPKELAKFRDGLAMQNGRSVVVSQIRSYFEGFHMDLLKNPPADDELPPNRPDTA